jgi:hypothetical protein
MNWSANMYTNVILIEAGIACVIFQLEPSLWHCMCCLLRLFRYFTFQISSVSFPKSTVLNSNTSSLLL